MKHANTLHGLIVTTVLFSVAVSSKALTANYKDIYAPYNNSMVASNNESNASPQTRENKRQLGQYFTVTNPFQNAFFHDWITPLVEQDMYRNFKFIEPFAGSNNIVSLLSDVGYDNLPWSSFDVDPPSYNRMPNIPVVQRDTIDAFPTGFDVAITNPPYLAKNSATKLKKDFPKTEHEDLYLVCLERMLANCKYVAAIIPESFLNQGVFQERLHGVISLNCRMFDDTDCPVCLALFNENANGGDFKYVKGQAEYSYAKLKEKASKILRNLPEKVVVQFNAPNGVIGLYAVDSNTKRSIRFVIGDSIPSETIKQSSRSITRISVNLQQTNVSPDELVKNANKLLRSYRTSSKDAFMTPFKGLRKDGEFRRRLDFETAKQILGGALWNLQNT